MEILLEVVKLSLSLGGLTFFAGRLIDAATALARGFGVSPVVIGLTLLAYGTSLPELAVSSISSVRAHSDLSVSNIVGSNIYNIAFVMGVASLISPIVVQDNRLARRDGVLMLFVTAVLILLSYTGGIGRPSGAVMVIAITLYTYYILRHDIVYGGIERDDRVSKAREARRCFFLLAGVLISANITVNSAVATARLLGVKEWLIGATIVAAGTSLPETVVSLIAARKGEIGMSVGNIVGSNTFNILWILGFASLLNPLSIDITAISWDLVFLSAVSAFFFIGLSKGKVSRTEGALYIAIYSGYIYTLLSTPS